jgi:predicted amidophosphoribosyltransferase
VAEASSLDRLYGSYLYESPVGSAIRAFKFDDVRALEPVLGGMFNIAAMSRSSADLVVPIPLHKSRLRSRDYIQSEILARQLSERLGLKSRNDVLVRVAHTVPQSELPTATAKHGAMLGGFATSSNASSVVTGKRVLLVDDVFTTGSTVRAAADALKSAGASWVGVAALTVQPIGALK